MLEWFWFIIGLWTALAYVAEIYNVIKSFRGKVDYRQYGIDSWALVTAPTDGIGLGFVEFLAKKGFNIVLVGRNPDKLKNLSKTLEESYRVSTKYVVKDFSLAAVNPVPFFTDLKQQTNGLDISIIVNNVGFGRLECHFTQTSHEEILSQNALNLWPIVFITRLYLPDFIARKNRCAFINLSSVLSILPIPTAAQYSAGKSFDHYFSLIVNQEIKYLTKGKAFPIDILSSRPGIVYTPMTSQLKQLPLAITRDECAQNMCKALGRVDYTSGHWKHQFMALLSIFNSNLIGFVLSKAILRDKKL